MQKLIKKVLVILLILDLDETLIHAMEKPLTQSPDFAVGPYCVYKRPYLDDFLGFCRMHFRVAVWTSSSAKYAGEVVSNIFGESYPLDFVWSRQRCTARFDQVTDKCEFSKNLNKVKRRGYPLERVLVVDDSPEKIKRHYGNLIQIAPFKGGGGDTELKQLMPYLLSLADEENVRHIEKRNWRYRKYQRAKPSVEASKPMTTLQFQQRVDAEGRFIRQLSEPGRYGHVVLIVEPSPEPVLLFSWEVSEDIIPSAYADAVLLGIRHIFSSGEKLAGVNCINTRVRIVGGSYNKTDSSPLCYTIAASIAFEDAIRKAGIQF